MTRRYYRDGRLKGYDVRKCLNCDSDKTYVHKDGRKQWHVFEDGYLCKKCYNNLILNPKLNPTFNDIWNSFSIQFLGVKVFLSFKPRKGYCTWCSNNVFDGSCKNTAMHHWFYLPIMMWACTEEICTSCHVLHHKKCSF